MIKVSRKNKLPYWGWKIGNHLGYLCTIPSPSFETILTEHGATKMGEYKNIKNGEIDRIQYHVDTNLLDKLNVPTITY